MDETPGTSPRGGFRGRGRPRGTRARARGPRGLGRGRMAQQRTVAEIVEDIVDVPSDAQQQLLDEEAEMLLDESNASTVDISDEPSDESAIHPHPTHPAMPESVPSAPPGEPIPKFTVLSWKATWRNHFFTDWRWAPGNSKNQHVWARCKTGECTKNTHYYSGGTTSFSNFEKHLNSHHKTLYEAFQKSQKSTQSGPSDPT